MWSKWSMKKLSTSKATPEDIIKIHPASFGIKWQGREYNHFDTNLPDLKPSQVDGVVIVEFRFTNLILIFPPAPQ